MQTHFKENNSPNKMSPKQKKLAHLQEKAKVWTEELDEAELRAGLDWRVDKTGKHVRLFQHGKECQRGKAGEMKKAQRDAEIVAIRALLEAETKARKEGDEKLAQELAKAIVQTDLRFKELENKQGQQGQQMQNLENMHLQLVEKQGEQQHISTGALHNTHLNKDRIDKLEVDVKENEVDVKEKSNFLIRMIANKSPAKTPVKSPVKSPAKGIFSSLITFIRPHS